MDLIGSGEVLHPMIGVKQIFVTAYSKVSLKMIILISSSMPSDAWGFT